MKVLLLSPYPELLLPALEEAGDTFWCRDEDDEWPTSPDWVVSFGHRRIIPQSVIDDFPNRIINIHISLLPWNRGADPNFWSWFDDTPKGVTIHRIDAGIDTGNIIVQKLILRHQWRTGETLSSSWHRLIAEAKAMFERDWKNIRRDGLPTRKADGVGSYHKRADKAQWMDNLPLGWDTPVKNIKRLGKEYRASQHEKEDRGPRPRKYRQQTLPEL